jgi:leucyl aminopeptidase
MRDLLTRGNSPNAIVLLVGNGRLPRSHRAVGRRWRIATASPPGYDAGWSDREDRFTHFPNVEAEVKLKTTTAGKWRGDVRLLLRTSNGTTDAGSKGVTVPPAAGKVVTVERNRRSGATHAVISLGPKENVTAETYRRAGGAAVSWLRDQSLTAAGIEVESINGVSENDAACALGEGLHLADYRFNQHRSNAEKQAALAVDLLVTRTSSGLAGALRNMENVCDGVKFARDLAHQPPNVVNPVTLAQRIKSMAVKEGLKCTVLDHRQLARLKMNAIVAVGQASATPPRLIVLEYPGRGKSAGKPVILIGKAITFDTGGYSIKTKEGIVGMKYDKCGGAAVIGAMKAVAAGKPKAPVVGIIAAAENMIGGNAYRPDDIITTMSGKTVQIVSADAEGRMVLCDALTYAQQKYKPRCLIDMATLTGGVMVALGKEAAGLFSNDDDLSDRLVESGRRVHERLWRLPLWDEYFELIKGDDSDFKNSAGREAHAIVGGVFLKQFVDPKVPWAHLDIAAVADSAKDSAYCPKGATGFGVRLVMDYIMGL